MNLKVFSVFVWLFFYSTSVFCMENKTQDKNKAVLRYWQERYEKKLKKLRTLEKTYDEKKAAYYELSEKVSDQGIETTRKQQEKARQDLSLFMKTYGAKMAGLERKASYAARRAQKGAALYFPAELKNLSGSGKKESSSGLRFLLPKSVSDSQLNK